MAKNKKDDVTNKVDWIIHAVFPSDSDDYKMDSHTHGLNKHNHPELRIVLNLPQEVIGNMLNGMGLDILKGERFDESGIYTNILANKMRVQIVRGYVGKDNCSTIIFPDPNGRLPGEPFCQEPYKDQLKYLEEIKEDYIRKNL